MVTVLSSSSVKSARKHHFCSLCGKVAAMPGEPYERLVCLSDDGDFVYNWIKCQPCTDIWDTVYAWVDPGWGEGLNGDDFAEWAAEHADDPEHGPAASAFLDRLSRSA